MLTDDKILSDDEHTDLVRGAGLVCTAGWPINDLIRYGRAVERAVVGSLPPELRAMSAAASPDVLLALLERLEAAERERDALAAMAQGTPGLRVTVSQDGVWMHFDAPSGKKGSIDIIALAEQRGGICGQAMYEWANALPETKEQTR
jgi:hypothetical protein